MFRIRKKMAYLAVIMSSIATLLCPFLKVFMVGSWNLYEVDVNLFYITNVFLLLILISVFFNLSVFLRFLTRFYFGWVVLAIAAVYFQVNNYFGMKLADGLISKAIVFKWGWLVLFIISFLLLFSVTRIKIDTNER